MSNRDCKARRQLDGGMRCERCGFLWDCDDPEPPACLDEKQVGREAVRNLREFIAAIPDDEAYR